MKRIVLKSSIAVLLIAFFSSCAMHGGFIHNSASLSSNNFSYVKKNLSGSSSALYVFGIGGLSKQALVDQAKQEMLGASPLGDNQALVNVTINWKKTMVVPFAITNKCTITADIVEFK